MKLSVLLPIAVLLSTASAVYPPVPVPESQDGSTDVVTIQDDKSNLNSIANENANLSAKPNSDISSSDSNISEIPARSSFKSFYMSVSMIVVSEIGDKTFLVAALMAMRHPHMVVLSSAASALAIMTILSGIMGHILPQLLSPVLTRFAAAALFAVFGINLLREGLSMSKDQGVDEELAEVEEEVAASDINERANIEAGQTIGPVSTVDYSVSQVKNLAVYVLSPAWVQTFMMTFLGEWGDRSQIATIAMAAGSDYLMVILGGCVGHFLCTSLAVVGGQMLAQKISMRTVLLGGSVAFFVFSVLYLYSAIYEE